VGLERGPLSIVSITEELLEWKRRGTGSRRPILTTAGIRCADHATPYIRKSGGRSVGIVRLLTKATEFSLVYGRDLVLIFQYFV
jgi:hypothetical protein